MIMEQLNAVRRDGDQHSLAHELVVLDGLCGGALDFFSP